MVRQLAAQRALDYGLLEAANRGVELLGRNRPLANELIKNLRGNRCEWCVRRQGSSFAGHTDSSCYASHTKILTPSILSFQQRCAREFEIAGEIGRPKATKALRDRPRRAARGSSNLMVKIAIVRDQLLVSKCVDSAF